MEGPQGVCRPQRGPILSVPHTRETRWQRQVVKTSFVLVGRVGHAQITNYDPTHNRSGYLVPRTVDGALVHAENSLMRIDVVIFTIRISLEGVRLLLALSCCSGNFLDNR